MRKRLLLFVLTLIFSSSTVSSAYRLNVHPAINENALIQSNTDNYLKSQLGFANGIEEVFQNQAIRGWIIEGATLQDETYCRSKFHIYHIAIKYS